MLTEFLLFFFFKFRFQQRRAAKTQVQPEEAQTEPKAPDAVYHATVVEPREKIPRKTVPEHRGTGRVFQFVTSNRDAGDYFFGFRI